MSWFQKCVELASWSEERYRWLATIPDGERGRIRKALDDAIQAALTDSKSPDAALKEAQSTADRLLRPYQ